jgi:hypothetical protein
MYDERWGLCISRFSHGPADPNPTFKGLHANGTGACTTCCNESPFQIGDGQSYVRANFSINGNTVTITAPFKGQATQVGRGCGNELGGPRMSP